MKAQDKCTTIKIDEILYPVDLNLIEKKTAITAYRFTNLKKNVLLF